MRTSTSWVIRFWQLNRLIAAELRQRAAELMARRRRGEDVSECQVYNKHEALTLWQVFSDDDENYSLSGVENSILRPPRAISSTDFLERRRTRESSSVKDDINWKLSYIRSIFRELVEF